MKYALCTLDDSKEYYRMWSGEVFTVVCAEVQLFDSKDEARECAGQLIKENGEDEFGPFFFRTIADEEAFRR